MLSLRKASTMALLAFAALGGSRGLEARSTTFKLITGKYPISVRLPKADGCKFEFKGNRDSPWIDARGTDNGSNSSTALGSESTYEVTISGFILSCNSVLSLGNGKGGREATITFSTSGLAPVSFKDQKIKEFGKEPLITLVDDNTLKVE